MDICMQEVYQKVSSATTLSKRVRKAGPGSGRSWTIMQLREAAAHLTGCTGTQTRQEGGPLYPTARNFMWLPLEGRHKLGQDSSLQWRSVPGWRGEQQDSEVNSQQPTHTGQVSDEHLSSKRGVCAEHCSTHFGCGDYSNDLRRSGYFPGICSILNISFLGSFFFFFLCSFPEIIYLITKTLYF